MKKTLVLFMACSSANITSTNTHAAAFGWAGPAAVVGSECVIFSSSPAVSSASSCWCCCAKSLRETLTEFRRRVLCSGNPLGLAVTSFGDADVKIS